VAAPDSAAVFARLTMPAGYSGTPLPKKLGIRPGHAVLLVRQPPGFAATLGDLPAGASATARAGSRRGAFDVVVLFVRSVADLREGFPAQAARLAVDGGLWVAWPKKASGVATDLHEGIVREIGLGAGLVDNKICAVDETWSGLRFVYRLADREKVAASRSGKKA
jgi:hypothetical protein